MFWGLTLEAGKHYSQSVEDSFHVSMAALELQCDYKDKSPRSPVQVMVQHQKKDFLLCSLFHGTLVQQQLDLDFTEGEQVTFYLEGNGVVHLTGYLVQEKPFDAEDEQILGSPPDSSEDGMEVSDDESDSKEDLNETIPSLQQLVAGKDLESSDESEEDWTPAETAESTKKRKLTAETPSPNKKKSKQKEEDEDGEPSDEEDKEADDEDITEEMADLFEDIEAHSGEKKGKEEGKEEKGKGRKENEETGDAQETSTKKKKRKKKKQQEKNQTENSKPKETNQTTEKSAAQTPAKLKKKLSNGVIIEDVVVGKGKLARPLRMVGVYYRGALAGRKQEFDSCLTGKPFRFRLGNKEVISGWDSGLIGMRIGGKRKLTIPPSQGYGKSRAGSIPPNSTLVFDVELKEVR